MATKDLTVGSPLKVLLTFSMPMLLSMMFQQFYSIADSIVIGQICGNEAFAAVSVSYPVTVLFVAFAGGASIGASVVTSQLFGEKRLTQVRTAAYTSLVAMGVGGAVLTLVGVIGCRPLLTALATDKQIFAQAETYLLIYIGGTVFLFLYNTANGIFTALGDSVTPLLLLIFSSVLNVALDIVLVLPPFEYGVAGAAWATFIAQGASSAIAFVLVLRRLRRLPDTKNGWRLFDRRLFVRIVRIAVPSICQQSFVSVGQLFVQRVINGFDLSVQSGYGGAFKINTFTISCLNTLGNALSSYTAQNTGAQRWDRIRDGRRVAMRVTCLFAVVVGALVMLFAQPLTGLFVGDADTQVKLVGQEYLWTVCPFYVIISIKIINDGVFRGTGSMKMFMASTCLDLGLRVTSSYVLSPFIGAAGVWWAFPIGWTSCTILSMLLYRFGKWAHAAQVRRGGRS